MSKRVKLGPELKRRFTERGFSMSRVAKELGLYENSLRSWIRRNRFPKRELLALCDFAGYGKKLESLRERFQFDIAGERKTSARRVTEFLSRREVDLHDALDVVEGNAREAFKGKGLFPEQLRLLFRSLGQGDLYVHGAFDRFPYEADGIGWSHLGKDLAAAAGRGAQLVYVYPNAEAVKQARSAGLRRIPTSEAWVEFMSAFAKRAMQSIVGSARNAVVIVQCGANPFFVPGVQLLLFRQSQPTVGPRLLVVLPLALSSGERTLLLPAAESMSGQFLEFLLVALEEAGHGQLLSP